MDSFAEIIAQWIVEAHQAGIRPEDLPRAVGYTCPFPSSSTKDDQRVSAPVHRKTGPIGGRQEEEETKEEEEFSQVDIREYRQVDTPE